MRAKLDAAPCVGPRGPSCRASFLPSLLEGGVNLLPDRPEAAGASVDVLVHGRVGPNGVASTVSLVRDGAAVVIIDPGMVGDRREILDHDARSHQTGHHDSGGNTRWSRCVHPPVVVSRTTH